jgi:hypothetical protein
LGFVGFGIHVVSLGQLFFRFGHGAVKETKPGVAFGKVNRGLA